MNFELHDILTIEDENYVLVSKVLYQSTWYFMLNKVDQEENLIPNQVVIYKQTAINTDNPFKLEPIVEENELREVTKLLNYSLLGQK